jgi:Asp-tRNA(Asn)/Glu-tRNA(Gln) amidotransferase B subunit
MEQIVSDDIEYIIDIETDEWLTGRTVNHTTGTITVWSKLTDKAYIEKFWFVEPPKSYLANQYGLEIDHKMSEALANLFDTDWVDFCYLLSLCWNKEDAIKLFTGPIAQMAKEQGVRALAIVNDRMEFLKLVNDNLTFNQRKAMLPDLGKVEYEELRKKHAFAEISDNEIDAAIESCIIDNRGQWEKATTVQPNLKNWFVGQIMKKYGGKIDAARVKQRVDNFG